jgi:hypothetical protein
MLNDIKKLMKHKDKIVLLFLILVPMAVMIQYPLNGRIFVTGDYETALNTQTIIWQAIMNGELPFWDKLSANGQPLYGLHGLFVHVLLFGWLPPEWNIFFLYCLLVSVASFFMYLFLKEINCNWKASLAVSIILLFSIHLGGFRRSHHISIIIAIALFPVVMYYIQRYINTKSFKYIAVSAGVLALAYNSGHTQNVVYLATVSGIYLVVWLIKEKVKPKVFIGAIALYSSLFFAFASVRLLPTFLMMTEYARGGTVSEVTFDYFSSYSTSPFSLIYMIFPRFFGNIYRSNGLVPASEAEIELFLGVIALLVAIFTVKAYVRKSFQTALSLGMCIFTFTYMSIGHVPGLRMLVFNLPVFGGFRCHARMLFAFVFFMYVLIAIGLTELDKNKKDIHRFFRFQYIFTGLIIVSSAFILMTTILLYGNPEPYSMAVIHNMRAFAEERLLSTLLVLVGVSIIFYLLEKIKTRISLTDNMNYVIVLATVTSAILIQTIPFWAMVEPRHPDITDPYDINDVFVRNTLAESIGNGKVMEASLPHAFHTSIVWNRNMPAGLPTINAHGAFHNPSFYRWLSGVQNIPLNASNLMVWIPRVEELMLNQNDLLSMMGVKYILDVSELLPDGGSAIYTSFLINDHVRIFENVNARDVLYFADEVRGIESTEYLFDTRYGLSLDRFSYIVGAKDVIFDLQGDIIEDIDFNFNSIAATVTTTDGGFLNFSQNYFPGWRVYINGSRTELKFVNSLIMGVYVPPGMHSVEFRFVNEGFIIGSIVTGGAIIICVLVFSVLPRLKSGAVKQRKI